MQVKIEKWEDNHTVGAFGQHRDFQCEDPEVAHRPLPNVTSVYNVKVRAE